jgi:hypothetical protein
MGPPRSAIRRWWNATLPAATTPMKKPSGCLPSQPPRNSALGDERAAGAKLDGVARRFSPGDRRDGTRRHRSARSPVLLIAEPARGRSRRGFGRTGPSPLSEQLGQKRTSSGHRIAPLRCRLSDTTRPSFRTSCRRRRLVMSLSGLAATTMRSASLPAYTSFRHRQWGIFIASIFYAFGWAMGVYRNF